MLHILYVHFHSACQTSVETKNQHTCPNIASMFNNITEKEGSRYSRVGPVSVYVSPKSATEPDIRQKCISVFDITWVEAEPGLVEKERNMKKQIKIFF